MESRKSQSQSNLISRVSSATELLPHTQSLHSKYSLYSVGGAMSPLPPIPSRPGSSRPQSRVDLVEVRPMSSRPMSGRPPSLTQLDQARPSTSRSPSRNTSRQQSAGPLQGQRPGSAIRPLSSRVFMRRMEHGWVAKHYPQTDRPGSKTNLSDDLEDGSDCESLDSFFDEEFDDRGDSEKLGDLLSCNTLGVESKGHKRDWNAGEVGIPKFHCPRCRDHWYGLTPFPCDEELARLIHEGLWYTGNGDPAKSYTTPKSGERARKGGGEGESGSAERGDTDSTRHRPKKILKGKSSENGSFGIDRNEAKKNKRKITFKLDSSSGTEEGSRFESERSGLLESRSGNGTTTDKSERLNPLSSSENSLHLDKFSEPDGTHSSVLNGVGPSDSGLDNTGHGESSNSGSSSLEHGQRKRVGLGGESTDGSSTNPLHVMTGSEKKASRAPTHTFGDKRGSKDSSSLIIEDETGLGAGNAPQDTTGVNSGNKSGLHTTTATSGSTDKQPEDSRAGDASVSLKQESSSTQGRKMSELAGPDYGRRVRKASGYMRASSPTGSEWGDPSHARPYASSTVTSSQTGSTSNLHKDRGPNSDRAPSSLPPIVPPIRVARRAVADFPEGGFDITPAWRYSYFSPSPLYTAADQRRTATTTGTRKK